ncbi:MAG: CMP/dCMP deaminase zinc-binding protein [Candidatus Gottesmanbacteria bacterium GW2011_GWB1_43_11]|uniref:CMP/dCMP deaminase zinc-binding protein n=1 Tax=Candidatus Gottesmanbacteria bacterium GW2011_GWB1_43_11 TaxID=1618446 RepID=A0A0G1CMA7_9BACT|nr:MAG: CMP/dCMP deaminase zinc-binding protein [Candidatus Gottesmanbacteria bacterium GW2011_GWA2_42_16]KKS51655.1 MAG: CMP/dCMP deaminase zinc-binding protein [Candidatus Gottesmanbacteria bacterium GW2011_GWA1_42_26]KKS82107.1 MAG: CMP/dCMP deaminase zinc-binding protein [Candidatus Gottesmanbacteria bacterium GW2011_GWC1_43_10]KKS86622.1 MAG: CMP/dCMP deaminase zinc-binding protein [Candidatus Gottesmanbacteria bacterium GW2011_GWB1_43_11]OGG09208.1 MAG: hypothetical protein A2699_02480 [C
MKDSKDKQFMREAIKEAEKAIKTGDWSMGCVIVLNNKIIGRGHNSGYSTKNRLAHAELLALEQAKDVLEKNRHQAVLYTTYDPCPMCVGAILVMKIKRVVTGINPDHSGGLDLLSHLPKFYQQPKFRIEVIRGVLVKECQEVYLKGAPTKKHIQQYDLKLTQL